MDSQIETKVWPFSEIGNRVESEFEIVCHEIYEIGAYEYFEILKKTTIVYFWWFCPLSTILKILAIPT